MAKILVRRRPGQDRGRAALLRRATTNAVAALAGMVIAAGGARAQSHDIIVTGAPLERAKGDAAYDVVTIDRSRIATTASNRIEDALKDVAGLQQFRRTDARSANATSQGATLRGLGGNASSRALLVLDGVPQSDPFGGWITWPAFAANRIGSVRVTRGGGSGAYGSGALAGTIEFDSIGSNTPSAAAFAYGSRQSLEGEALLSGRLGSGFGFVAASYARGDGFIPIVKGQRGPADMAAPYEQASLAARGVAPLSADTELQASMLAFTDRRTRGTIMSGNGGDGADASLRIVHKGRWQMEALGYVQARQFKSRFVSVDATRATVVQTTDQYDVPSTGIGGRIEVRPPIGSGKELRIGTDWRRTTGETNELFTYVAGQPTRIREAGGASDTYGAFAESSATLGDVTLTGGGRIDRWTIRNGRLIERTLATGAFIRNEIAPDRTGTEPTGRAGIAWKTGDLRLRSAAYLGWRLPTLNELYRPFRVGADATAANPALRPERMKGAEIGIGWSRAFRAPFIEFGDEDSCCAIEGGNIVGSASVQVTAFTNRLTSAIANVTLGRGPGTFPGVGFVAAGGVYRQRLNVDAIRSRGIEMDARLHHGDWRLQASYAYTDAKVQASGTALALDGLRPAQVPKHLASATLGWKWIAATTRYVSAQYEDDGNTRRLRGAVTFDAVATVPLSSRLSLVLRGENLTDTRIDAAISATGVIERATPRTMWAGIRMQNLP